MPALPQTFDPGPAQNRHRHRHRVFKRKRSDQRAPRRPAPGFLADHEPDRHCRRLVLPVLSSDIRYQTLIVQAALSLQVIRPESITIQDVTILKSLFKPTYTLFGTAMGKRIRGDISPAPALQAVITDGAGGI